MRKISAFFIIFLSFILFSLVSTKQAFAYSLSNCNPTNGQPFNPGATVNFGGDLYWDLDIEVTADFRVYVTGPENWISTPYTATIPSANGFPYSTGCVDFTSNSFNTPGVYSWYINATDGVNSYNTTSTTFIINTPPEITFSNPNPPNGATIANSTVTFSITINDNNPDPSGRDVILYIDGVQRQSTTYFGPQTNLTLTSSPFTLSQGLHTWYVVAGFSSYIFYSNNVSPYSFTISAPNDPPNQPTELDPFYNRFSEGYTGIIGPDGNYWFNGSTKYHAYVTDPNNDPLDVYFNTPTGTHTVSYGSSPANAIYVESLPDGIYSWSVYSKDPSGATSPTVTGPGFGIDTTNPSMPGTPVLNLVGGNWYVDWSYNGTDQPGTTVSGLFGVVLRIDGQDIINNVFCNTYWYQGGNPPTSTPFSCGSQNTPQPNYRYTFSVYNTDWASNKSAEKVGSYESGFMAVYNISGNVFVDYNGDGIKNTSAGFPPDTEYAGGDVQIYMNGTQTTNTDGFGNYAISNLPNGSYTLGAAPPAGYITVNKPAVGMPNPRTAFINNADSYGNDFAIQPLGGPPPTSTPPPAGYPIIRTLKTKNPQALTFTGIFGTSGRQNTEDGSNWLNPMRIRLSVEQGTNSIKRYYVAFYGKSSGAKLTNINSFISDVKARLSNPKNGFLLAYGIGELNGEFYNPASPTDYSSNNFYVWNKNTWKKIPTGSPQTVYDGTTAIYTVSRIAASIEAGTGYRYVTWEVKFNKDLGSKLFYTPAFVIDTAGQSDFNYSVTVTELLN